ncbi:aminotransferase-like domain-containing protein [Acrocarpospora catenulata]|uniref:aminotransferase-like domain-containing protein n=1 Tax=Acrocarpospora catenulata TaxID=2836182 RepID=UPI001BDAAD60|nr:PLP-dependent aminotransferase family protein [Acrocarpospora catenulata]
MRNAQRLSVPIELERSSSRSLHEQLAEQLRKAIDIGQFAPGMRMPSTRTMADVLQVSRGVVVTAYELLLAEGHITGRKGSGTYVSAQARATLPPVARAEPDEDHVRIDMTPGRAGTQGFPLTEWRSAWRRASHSVPYAEEAPPLGRPELRQAIALHLRDSRGLVLDRHEVIVANGYPDAVRLLVQAMGEKTVIGLEDPAAPRTRAALSQQGPVLPVPVDEEGVHPGLIPDDCDLLVVTPERNDPLGVRLAPERRREVAAWAAEHDRIVVEPAFDGVFGSGGSPLPSIMAIGDPASTVMIGTFDEVFTPALRLAYVVAPRDLAYAMADRVVAGHEQPSAIAQQAAAELLRSGTLNRRLNRLSTLYAPKRQLVRATLGGFAEITLLGADNGAPATLLLPPDVRAREIVHTLRARDLLATELAEYGHPDGPRRNGVVLGYGHLGDMPLRRALRVIIRTLDEHGLARRTSRYQRTVA